ncbi:ABC transporter ATP-binding protein/permease [Paenibacillus sp. CC-CFT747]|nr:ABC transporter ATP-binding protein/permease [Paenibacillus sp. CC-CFT747]
MKVFIRLFASVRPYKGWVALAVTMLAAGVAFDLLAPWLLKQAIDKGIAEKSLAVVIFYTLMLGLGQLLKTGVSYVQGYAQELVGQNVIFDLRQKLYAHLQRLSYSYYDKAQTGQLMSRMTGDIEAVKNFTGFGLMFLITGFLTFAGTFVVMLAMQWKVTLISMVTIPLILVSLRQFNRKVGPAWGDIREQMGKLTTTLQENISGIRVVKAFAQEKKEKAKFDERNETNFQSNLSRAKLEAGAFPLMGFYGGVVFLLMNWVGGLYVIREEMSIGTLMAFQWYAWGIIWPLNMLGWLVNITQQAAKAAPRVFEILDTPLAVDSPPGGGIRPAGMTGAVRFERVSFHYPAASDEEKRDVLKHLSLEVQPGEAVAVLGGTGSGKSTLIQLLARFYDVTEGELLIDGRNVKEYNLEELRRKIAIVPQETFLFSASIRDNIAFGCPDSSQEQVEWAARQAQIHDFILTMPDGYETIVGERGVGLSGGQRQRVALARAILMDPPILVLDEATASVDTATESAIHDALHAVMKGRTTFIVAQRLSSIQRADRIIVLENGTIAEQGTHKELYEKDGFFRRLFRLQQGTQEREADAAELKAAAGEGR